MTTSPKIVTVQLSLAPDAPAGPYPACGEINRRLEIYYATAFTSAQAVMIFESTSIRNVYCIDVPDCFLAACAADAEDWYRRQKEKK